jgi:nucleotide-binding universal stress UspA family protein
MRILHVKGSDLAWAPDAIVKAINEHTEHHAEPYHIGCDEKSDRVVALGGFNSFDIVHFHNKPRAQLVERDAPSLIQYHSEPGPRVDLTYQGPKYVVAQYHMTLPEYRDCKPMRNIVEIPEYTPRTGGPLKVAYSPSILHAENRWYDKGAEQTREILERIQARFPSHFDYDIIHGVPLPECIRRKAHADIIIDECVTGSYHRSGLEGLALGKYTITGTLLPELTEYLESFEGWCPFAGVGIDSLYDHLCGLVAAYKTRGEGFIGRRGKVNREWLIKYWSPETLAKEWITEYEKVLNAD